MLIRITSPALALDADDQPVTKVKTLKALNGLKATDKCENYLSSRLADQQVTGGEIRLVYDAAAKKLFVITEYKSPAKLSAANLRLLVKETRAQYTDGIGEGDFSPAVTKLGVSLELAPDGSVKKTQVEQAGTPQPKGKNPTRFLKTAVSSGNLEKVRKLLEQGADPNHVQQGFSVLDSAVRSGKVEVVLELIARGADVNAKDMLGCDPILTCALDNTLKDEAAAVIARALLEKKVNPNAKRKYGLLYMARIRKKTKLAKVYKEFGAKT